MNRPISDDVRAEPTGSPERFIRTLKELLLRVRTFETIEQQKYGALAA